MGNSEATRQGQWVLRAILGVAVLAWLAALTLAAAAAPYADFVVDARTGQVLRENNADARLHPASLTKMMTLYVAFEAIERGEITLDTMVTVSKNAASEQPSRLGLRAGQKIALRYLIRAAAIKSANDAATAIGEAIEGSEEAFAQRMTRTARALGMSRSSFRNAHGLTQEGHLSTARDMTTLGRHLFYDYPQYYNIFSRRWADAGVAKVASTNRRFLEAYEGADGIKTGYTVAAGFNLVASAQRGDKRIIATVFGGTSTAWRNQRVAELLDIGFGKAPNRATVQKPSAPDYVLADGGEPGGAGKTVRVSGAIETSVRPTPRPVFGATPEAPAEELLLAMQENIDSVLAAVQSDGEEDPGGAASIPLDEADTSLAAAAPAAAAPDEQAVDVAALASAALAETGTAQPAEAAAPQAVAPEAVALASPAAPAFDARPTARPVALAAETTVAAAEPAAAPASEPAPAQAVATGAPAPEPAVPSFATETIQVALPAASASETVALAAADATAAPMTPIAPEQIILAEVEPAPPAPAAAQEVVTRVSTSGGRQWGINVGNYSSRYLAERVLLQTALTEMNTLDEALRKVVPARGGFDATFVGMTEETAQLACRRLAARNTDCAVVTP